MDTVWEMLACINIRRPLQVVLFSTILSLSLFGAYPPNSPPEWLDQKPILPGNYNKVVVTWKPVLGSGGSLVTNIGSYRIHTFTTGETFTVTTAMLVDALVVGGGGGGGSAAHDTDLGSGGGGAGGYVYSTGLSVTAGNYFVTIGAGGAGATNAAYGGNGTNSIFASITAFGGGGGAQGMIVGSSSGLRGGCGGGACNYPSSVGGVGVQGGTGAVTTFQVIQTYSGGGGGGCGGNGVYTNGGPGLSNSISGAIVVYGGGGGGSGSTPAPGGYGGIGGGGCGTNITKGTPGIVNTGGGGGGGAGGNSGAGGSGIVIIRYANAGGTSRTNSGWQVPTISYPHQWESQITTPGTNIYFSIVAVGATNLYCQWGDGSVSNINGSVTMSHYYPTAGTYTVQLNGYATNVMFGSDAVSRSNLIQSLGPIQGVSRLTSLQNTFLTKKELDAKEKATGIKPVVLKMDEKETK